MNAQSLGCDQEPSVVDGHLEGGIHPVERLRAGARTTRLGDD